MIGRSSATGAGDTAATVKKEVKQEPSSDSASSPTPKPTSETGAIPKSIKKVRFLFLLAFNFIVKDMLTYHYKYTQSKNRGLNRSQDLTKVKNLEFI